MSFKIVRAETRLANMMTWFAGVQRSITDFVVGGKTRSKLEAVAVEMEAMDYQTFRAIRKAIPASIYQAFKFKLRPAARASGLITFTAIPAPVQDIVIPKGTLVATAATSTTNEKVYATTAAAVIQAGQTSASVAVTCNTPGVIGNTGPNTITVSKTSIGGSITAITNPAGFSNGTDVETEDARKIRFTQYISTLTRGTAAAVAFGATNAFLTDESGAITEQVTAAIVAEPPEDGPAGAFTCYIYNGAAGASADLVARAQQVIDGYIDETGTKVPGYKAAGIVATVTAATTTPMDVTASVTAIPGIGKDALQNKVVSAVTSYIQNLGLGEKFIYHEMIERVMAIAGVADVAVATPTANMTPLSNQVFIPGEIEVTVQ